MNTLHYVSHRGVCVAHVQLIYTLRYNRHRRQQCVRVSKNLCEHEQSHECSQVRTHTNNNVQTEDFLFWHQGEGAISF